MEGVWQVPPSATCIKAVRWLSGSGVPVVCCRLCLVSAAQLVDGCLWDRSPPGQTTDHDADSPGQGGEEDDQHPFDRVK